MNNYSATPKKRSKSIVFRLTAFQVWRSVLICVRVNVIAVFIYAAVVFIYANYNACALMPVFANAQTSDAVNTVAGQFGYAYQVVEGYPRGLVIPDRIAGKFNMPSGTSVYIRAENGSWRNLRYEIHAPVYPGECVIMSYDLYPALRVMLSGLSALTVAEIIFIIFSIFPIRRTTRRILRPINDLTAAAQSINTKPAPTPLPPELKLTGAIDTLNTITEDHLDKRIMIDDEREELKGLAAAINAMLDRIDLAYQAQLRFVSDASHELRTPISVIQGYANLLDRWGKRDEKALQESIDAIKCEAMGMEGLVEQLLFLARSDNNSIKIEPKETDISLLVDEVLRETEMIDGKHIISGNIDKDICVYGDAQLLKQAVRVFVDNAIKYTPEGGRIRLSVTMAGGEARLSVSDTGIGIPESDITHVFERFFRADASRARKTGGTGLGLSIAKYIIDSHGGYVEIVSRENIGTKITAALPARLAMVSGQSVETVGESEIPKAV